jgi:DeoR/GlpR family transcriptional regulator of sugar metabolism
MNKRREKLVEYLVKGRWNSYILARALHVSERTIRRDIAALRKDFNIRSGVDGYWIPIRLPMR